MNERGKRVGTWVFKKMKVLGFFLVTDEGAWGFPRQYLSSDRNTVAYINHVLQYVQSMSSNIGLKQDIHQNNTRKTYITKSRPKPLTDATKEKHIFF